MWLVSRQVDSVAALNRANARIEELGEKIEGVRAEYKPLFDELFTLHRERMAELEQRYAVRVLEIEQRFGRMYAALPAPMEHVLKAHQNAREALRQKRSSTHEKMQKSHSKGYFDLLKRQLRAMKSYVEEKRQWTIAVKEWERINRTRAVISPATPQPLSPTDNPTPLPPPLQEERGTKARILLSIGRMVVEHAQELQTKPESIRPVERVRRDKMTIIMPGEGRGFREPRTGRAPMSPEAREKVDAQKREYNAELGAILMSPLSPSPFPPGGERGETTLAGEGELKTRMLVIEGKVAG